MAVAADFVFCMRNTPKGFSIELVKSVKKITLRNQFSICRESCSFEWKGSLYSDIFELFANMFIPKKIEHWHTLDFQNKLIKDNHFIPEVIFSAFFSIDSVLRTLVPKKPSVKIEVIPIYRSISGDYSDRNLLSIRDERNYEIMKFSPAKKMIGITTQNYSEFEQLLYRPFRQIFPGLDPVTVRFTLHYPDDDDCAICSLIKDRTFSYNFDNHSLTPCENTTEQTN